MWLPICHSFSKTGDSIIGLYLAKWGEYFSAEGEGELQEEQPPQLWCSTRQLSYFLLSWLGKLYRTPTATIENHAREKFCLVFTFFFSEDVQLFKHSVFYASTVFSQFAYQTQLSALNCSLQEGVLHHSCETVCGTRWARHCTEENRSKPVNDR